MIPITITDIDTEDLPLFFYRACIEASLEEDLRPIKKSIWGKTDRIAIKATMGVFFTIED